jgi:hypothetical protein
MSERDIDVEDVRREHMDDVHVVGHVLYLAGVLIGGSLLMLGLLVLLDALS